MNTLRRRKLGRTFLVAFAVVGAAQACGKDATPVDAPVITSGSGGDSGAGGKGGKGGTRGDAGTAGTGNPGGESSGGSSGSTSTGGRGGSTTTGGTSGTGADGGTGNEGGGGSDCVQNPTDPGDFLIRCTESRCAPFDNFARIPGYDGTLPDL